jgi:hypothetical protein
MSKGKPVWVTFRPCTRIPNLKVDPSRQSRQIAVSEFWGLILGTYPSLLSLPSLCQVSLLLVSRGLSWRQREALFLRQWFALWASILCRSCLLRVVLQAWLTSAGPGLDEAGRGAGRAGSPAGQGTCGGPGLLLLFLSSLYLCSPYSG